MSEATKQNIDEGTEENMLVSWFETRFGFLKPHYKTIAIVAGLLVLAAILFMFLQKLKRDNYASQCQGFNQSYCNTFVDGKPSHLTDLAEQFPDAISSNWAMLIAGDITLNEGLALMGCSANPNGAPINREQAIKKLKKAKAHYQAVVDSKIAKKPMLEKRAVFRLAYAMESLGEFEQAGEYYAQLVESDDAVFADAARRGLSRSKNSNLSDFYTAFRTEKIEPAPGVRMADRPAIEFPAFDLPEGEAVAGPQFLDGSVEPEATEPEATEPEATEPEATEPEATEPEATESEATESEAAESEAAEPEAAEPEAMPEEAGGEDN